MIVALSAAHQRFTVSELQKLDAVVLRTRDLLAAVTEVAGVAILATCHRVEIYIDASDSACAEQLAQTELASSGVVRLAERLERFVDVDAAEHLFWVASGLKSMVVGENEVAGQVKVALGNAQDAGTMSPGLYRLFRSAMRTAKAVAATALGQAGRSLVGAALGEASYRSALVIGTGSFARVAVKQLAMQGCERIAVYSPSGRAAAFAASRDVVPIERDELDAELVTTDLVLGCSGQGTQTLTIDMVASAMQQRQSGLNIVDLALRRDVDQAVAMLPGVRFTDLDTVSSDAPVDDSSARTIIANALADYLADEKEQGSTQAVRGVRDRVQVIAERELERAMRRLSCLTPEQTAQVELLVHRITQGVLHQPTMRARECAKEGRIDAFEEALALVFGAEKPGS